MRLCFISKEIASIEGYFSIDAIFIFTF
jgi:hypothetical protein